MLTQLDVESLVGFSSATVPKRQTRRSTDVRPCCRARQAPSNNFPFLELARS